MSDTDENSGVLFGGTGTYDKEYRRLRTLSSRTDIRQVSVSVHAGKILINQFCI